MEPTFDSDSGIPPHLKETQKPALAIERRPGLLRYLNGLLVSFSPGERLFLYILTISLALSAWILVIELNRAISTEVPASGGTLVEGAVGTPRFVNPLLSITQSDQDLTALVYSGLLRVDPEGGYIPDIAESYTISDDGTTYTFNLRSDVTFHDGTPLTAEDVLFTIARAQNPDVKSARRADWEGVVASKTDDDTIVFTLPNAYAPFVENTTIGILPKHLWENVPASEFQFSQLNTEPVGSGPYRFKSVTRDNTGAPVEYTLIPFNNFTLGTPHIKRIVYRIYTSTEALVAAYEEGAIDSFVVASPKSLPETTALSANLFQLPLTRVFGVFLNQSHAPVLADAAARTAIDQAVDKHAIVQTVLGGYAEAVSGPIPPGIMSRPATSSSPTRMSPEERIEMARATLSAGGWSFSEEEQIWKKGTNRLAFTLSTADTEELVATANMLSEQWRAAGIPVTVQVYPLTDFNLSVLRPRTYDAILFGEIVGRSLDLFAFWHSSQRNDPGLNLSLYTNAEADKKLASARAESNRLNREALFQEFAAILAKDTPAVFLYSPRLAYMVPKHLNGMEVGALTQPSDRFKGVYRWYRDTERVWTIFAPGVQEGTFFHL